MQVVPVFISLDPQRDGVEQVGGAHELCCALFESLGDDDDDRHAIEHRDTVARFGRFPHRNDALGRDCTPEELDYLKTAKRYGQ